MWVKARGQTRYVIYQTCLSGRSSACKSERSETYYVVYSMGGAMLVKASGQTCYLPHLSKWVVQYS